MSKRDRTVPREPRSDVHAVVESPAFEAPAADDVVTSAPEPDEAPVVQIVAKDSVDDALAKRLTDYVHHRLNQHLPSAVDFYVQELRDVIAGKH